MLEIVVKVVEVIAVAEVIICHTGSTIDSATDAVPVASLLRVCMLSHCCC